MFVTELNSHPVYNERVPMITTILTKDSTDCTHVYTLHIVEPLISYPNI